MAEAASVARLLDEFNREYDMPTPGKAELATHLRRLLAGRDILYSYRELGITTSWRE